jgi:TonB family protein
MPGAALSPEPRVAVALADTLIDLQPRPVASPQTEDPQMPVEQQRILARALERGYAREHPRQLRGARGPNRIVLWVLIDEQGRTQNVRVLESSRQQAYDELVQHALRAIEWIPARDQDEPIPVWMPVPISLEPNRRHAAPPEAEDKVHVFVPENAPRLLNREERLGRIQHQGAVPACSGRVVVRMFVDESGEVRHMRLVQAPGDARLNEWAREVVRTARFAPAQDQGEAVAVWIELPITCPAEPPSS